MISINKLRTLQESIRQGLPHITTMDTDQFHGLTHSGKVHLHSVTEKTDGSTFMIGHDQHGFYTQSSGSGSERMRKPEHYIDRVTKRAKETGKEPDYTGAKAFAAAHEALQNNTKLTTHLQNHAEKNGGETTVRGELFSRKLARPSEDKKGEVKLVGTSYDPSRWGKTGQIVIHSKLPENEKHDPEHFKNHLSDHEMTFDHDKIDHKPSHVNVSDEHESFKGLNHGLIKSRTTPSNRDMKAAEIAKFDAIKKRVSDKIDTHAKSLNLSPKFGSGSEGLVVHPKPGTQAPRFKITSDAFRSYKADPESKAKFKKRTLSEIVSSFEILLEGGNVKVKTSSGGVVSAAPFAVKNRSEQASHVHEALSSIHDAFHAEHGEHLFGNKKQSLHKGTTFAGSTKAFMDKKIPDKEFSYHKPTVGDIDIQIHKEHKNKLDSVMKPGRRFGQYTVVGNSKHGTENSFVMRHKNGEHHQFDFEGVDHDKGEPTKGSQFLHSSDWGDTTKGIKGLHHKMLLNAVGGDTHKFSNTYGLRSRTDDKDPGTQDPKEVSTKLFGKDAQHNNIHSFTGVADLIKKHVPKERHQEIYDKFKSSTSSEKYTNHEPAITHLRNTLGVKDNLKESKENDQHAHVSFMGASPHTHMGHVKDVIGSMGSGRKFVGLSGKSDVFSDSERANILNRQSDNQVEAKVEKTAGETVGRAFHSMDADKPRHLHLHFGADRKAMAEGLKAAIEKGKIPELKGQKPHSVTVHIPKDENRSHGMSGTKMRKAASENDLETYHKHLGPSFTRKEAGEHMKRIQGALSSGKIKLVREEIDHKKFGPMLDNFVSFASDKLGIKSLPKVNLIQKGEGSFGGYNPSENCIHVSSKNRHPIDVFRTIAHELVHHKQNVDGRLKDVSIDGSTGSDIENEANSEAGKIMRWYAKANPKHFDLEHITEETLREGLHDPARHTAVFLAGGPGCFIENTKILMFDGSTKNIQDITIGEKMADGNIVIETHQYKNTKPLIEVYFDDETSVICTEDHEFLIGDKWIEAKDLLSIR